MPRGIYDRSKSAAAKGAAPKTSTKTSPKAAPKAQPKKSVKTQKTQTKKTEKVAAASVGNDVETLRALNHTLDALTAAAENINDGARLDSLRTETIERIAIVSARLEPLPESDKSDDADVSETVQASETKPAQAKSAKAPPAPGHGAQAQAPFVAQPAA